MACFRGMSLEARGFFIISRFFLSTTSIGALIGHHHCNRARIRCNHLQCHQDLHFLMMGLVKHLMAQNLVNLYCCNNVQINLSIRHGHRV